MSEDQIILTHILQCRAIDLIINKPELNPSQQEQFQEYKLRRIAGEPLQYILGTCNFMGLELAVNPSVLVPRPETEQLVDRAIKILSSSNPSHTMSFQNPSHTMSFQNPSHTMSSPNVFIGDPVKILDLGTGSGNIAIALAKFIPQSQIVSVDKSGQALELARANAKTHGVEDRIKFVCVDMYDSLNNPYVILSAAKDLNMSVDSSAVPQNDNRFDLIISNPPYIPTSQLESLPKDVKQEPLGALDGGEDGLDFYRIIIKYSPCLLRKGACLMMEFGDGQAEAIKGLMKAQPGFESIQIYKDLAGRKRIINGKIYH